jgi:Fur family peroxide stress response transcriptional regulator
VQECSEYDFTKFRRVCRERGLRITPQREAVYETVAGMETHPSTEEVYRAVVKRYPNISFDTVNRTLNTFAEEGLIDVVESVSGVRRFDPKGELHHHLHCIKCGKIIDFFHPGFNELKIPPGIGKEFQVLKSRVSVSGICGTCLMKK